MFKCFGKINFLIIPLAIFLCVAECVNSVAECAKCPRSTCTFSFGGKIIIIKSKLKPILLGIVFYTIEFFKEHFCFSFILITSIKQIYKSSCWVHFTSHPCRNIEEETTLFAESLKALEFVGQLVSM